MNGWLYLTIAIIAEVIATSSLKASAEFTRFWPSVAVVLGYLVAFYCLSLTLKWIPLGIVYAVWAGLGVVLVAAVGWLIYGQRLDAVAVAGMALIVLGVVLIQLSSSSEVT